MPPQELHPAAGQFLLGLERPSSWFLRTFQRTSLAVVQAMADRQAPSVVAAKQGVLEALAGAGAGAEDNSQRIETSDRAADGDLPPMAGWSMSSSKGALAGHLLQQDTAEVADAAVADVDVVQVDQWRTAACLLPATLGQTA
jgi:hypothetical protein